MSPQSLNSMIATSVSLQQAHARFVREYSLKRRVHSQKSLPLLDATLPVDVNQVAAAEFYGYEDASPDMKPPTKKRRFERRCSKTPRMLMSLSASLLSIMDGGDEEEEAVDARCQARLHRSEPCLDKDADWEGGLQIAQELVQQLQHHQSPSRGHSCCRNV